MQTYFFIINIMSLLFLVRWQCVVIESDLLFFLCLIQIISILCWINFAINFDINVLLQYLQIVCLFFCIICLCILFLLNLYLIRIFLLFLYFCRKPVIKIIIICVHFIIFLLISLCANFIITFN